jgi:hypothetical protein
MARTPGNSLGGSYTLGMTRDEMETEITVLADQRWRLLMESLNEARKVQIQQSRNVKFGDELVLIHETHYDALLDKILALAKR